MCMYVYIYIYMYTHMYITGAADVLGPQGEGAAPVPPGAAGAARGAAIL